MARMIEGTLRLADLTEVASKAQKLARLGHITGEAALCLIIWPNPPDMLRFVNEIMPRLQQDDLELAA
jgi:hypothetical protein